MIWTFLFLAYLAGGQEYKVSTTQTDSFSVALVKLLNCASSRFQECKGGLISSTSLMGDDYQLSFSFPGSTIAIVRTRDWEKNAYIEFRGFEGKKDRDKGIKNLVAKIKGALGDQLYDPYENKPGTGINFYGLSLKDRQGYFSMNMELFGGTSAAPVYLLGPEREDRNLPGKDFILLKVYGGIPAYQYYIKETVPPDIKIDSALRWLINVAGSDFDPVRVKQTTTWTGKFKRRDTLQIQGLEVILNYTGTNFSANLYFPADTGNTLEEQWHYYQQVIRAALGIEYVYQLYTLRDRPCLVYYSTNYGENNPRVYLDLEMRDNQVPRIHVRIESAVNHPTKRRLDREDL